MQGAKTAAWFYFSAASHPLAIQAREFVQLSGHDYRNIGLVVPITLILSLVIISSRRFLWRFPITMIGLMAIVQLIYYAFILTVWTREWYFTGWYIAVLFAAAFALSSVIDRLHIVPTSILVGLVLIAILVVNIDRRNDTWSVALQQNELLVEYNKPGNVLVGPNPDRAAYFSGVPIRHLEGKVNGYDFIRSYLIPRRVASYVKNIGATHYVFSNAGRPEGLPCQLKIISDQDVVVYGEYDRHNDELFVYRISTRPELTPVSDHSVPNCGSAEGSLSGG